MTHETRFPYQTPRAFETALTTRFKKLAGSSAFSHAQLRRQFAYDRLLARCFVEEDRHRWILKGGISMLARLEQARHSADIDLAVEAESLTGALTGLRRATSRDLGDHFTFELSEPRSLVQGVEGVRVPVQALLGRRVYEKFHVDLVTGVQVTGVPEMSEPIVALDIPGLVRPDYRLYPLADSVADKVCAIVERHQGRPSTRFRDLCDLVLIARSQSLGAADLRRRSSGQHSPGPCPAGGGFPSVCCGAVTDRHVARERHTRHPLGTGPGPTGTCSSDTSRPPPNASSPTASR
ncbi:MULTISPECIES: nucleotidyl transferase AbiEii/AbiGii toxin family protein [unclassified Streptomyces]|uniref:nucleotidyl transferase AbiEii/AbiGii toxin family protein n=1 Tax=unclassified Streptomyces TaxID=2593676 RepID=UPI00278BB1F6|nr:MULTISPECIES: nucleotidyl transferase AbiEii/AbiGii toxin family protein [unclassified Streptomyces]